MDTASLPTKGPDAHPDADEQFALFDASAEGIAKKLMAMAIDLCAGAGIVDGALVSSVLQEAVAQHLKDNSPPCRLADRFRTAADNFHQAARAHLLSNPNEQMVSFETAITFLPSLSPAGPWTLHATVLLEGIASGHSIHLVHRDGAIRWTAKRIMDPVPYGRGSADTETNAFREAFAAYAAALAFERGAALLN